MQISILKKDLANRWHRKDATTVNYLSDDGWLMGGKIVSEDDIEIVYKLPL